MSDNQLANDINLVARFLAAEDLNRYFERSSVDCIVVCVSQILAQANLLFRTLETKPTATKTLVVIGGVGHSTQSLYDAVARHPTYHVVASEVQGLPEARVVGVILNRFFDVSKISSQGCKILFEDRSTNCGANATETRRVLESASVPIPQTCAIVQDPTMVRRSIASFKKAFEGASVEPKFLGCPLFVPKMGLHDGRLEYEDTGVPIAELWPKQRFYDLLVGEIPRLVDSRDGYGPKGKGFIAHVDVPESVQEAGDRIKRSLSAGRTATGST